MVPGEIIAVEGTIELNAGAEVVEVTGDRQLVRDGEVDPLLLRAVAHRRVVDVERRGHLALPGSRAKG